MTNTFYYLCHHILQVGFGFSRRFGTRRTDRVELSPAQGFTITMNELISSVPSNITSFYNILQLKRKSVPQMAAVLCSNIAICKSIAKLLHKLISYIFLCIVNDFRSLWDISLFEHCTFIRRVPKQYWSNLDYPFILFSSSPIEGANKEQDVCKCKGHI